MVSRPLLSIAERVRNEWLEAVSRKITGLYSGWMPGFMGREVYACPDSASTAAHRVEELRVRLGGLELVDQELGGFQLVHGVQELPQHPHLLQDRVGGAEGPAGAGR